ncbi:SRPBCC family protein [Subsaxibacter sp. CAU 1640]|uniref:SRPBCC family protein n=1 Tax=Subsaxibacter sp. CAU 1640 TaxID=2933271 RepID=UPI0020047233|nr:SRPBCC family protein [Subsaxibacter sp. CAU 1640]MCK7590493.1 SRPBCC family protein [Subsaxibacter sp. CAU 1640]
METTKVTVETTVNAEPQKAWDYYTQPEHITQWNFASDDWCCPKAENDVRVGGKMKSRMEAKDGSMGFDFEATYDKVENQKALVYTMPDGRQVRTDFKEEKGKTTITTVFDAENQNPVEMQKGGWQAILDNYKKHVEEN